MKCNLCKKQVKNLHGFRIHNTQVHKGKAKVEGPTIELYAVGSGKSYKAITGEKPELHSMEGIEPPKKIEGEFQKPIPSFISMINSLNNLTDKQVDILIQLLTIEQNQRTLLKELLK